MRRLILIIILLMTVACKGKQEPQLHTTGDYLHFDGEVKTEHHQDERLSEKQKEGLQGDLESLTLICYMRDFSDSYLVHVYLGDGEKFVYVNSFVHQKGRLKNQEFKVGDTIKRLNLKDKIYYRLVCTGPSAKPRICESMWLRLNGRML